MSSPLLCAWICWTSALGKRTWVVDWDNCCCGEGEGGAVTAVPLGLAK